MTFHTASRWKWQAPKLDLEAGDPALSDGDLLDLQRLQQCIKGAGGI